MVRDMIAAALMAAVLLTPTAALAADAMTYRQLKLLNEPTSESAPHVAADMVRIALAIDGIRLGYSIQSLRYVDVKIDEFRSVGYSAEDIGDALLGFGCYAGEVFVRHAGGTWKHREKEPDAASFKTPLVVVLGNGKVCDPITTAFARLRDGAPASLHQLYLDCTKQ